VLKLGYHLSRWKFVGLDRSQRMIAKANQALATAPELAGRIGFMVADGNKLDFPDHSFDLVMCNSVLHHLEDPQKLFSEMARLLKPGGALLLRDLVRPARLGFGHHVRKHGKHYSGEMKRLYVASLHAAYTEQELQRLIEASALRGHVKVFRHRNTHIGFARAVSSATKK
jgi:ubiquinone/menaquinone biosynthesis C-methylase UbiE